MTPDPVICAISSLLETANHDGMAKPGMVAAIARLNAAVDAHPEGPEIRNEGEGDPWQIATFYIAQYGPQTRE